MQRLLDGKHPFVTGTKQTLKAVERGSAKLVYLAEDASDFLKEKITKACQLSGVEICIVPDMKTLGKCCAIGRGAACACLIKQ